MTRKLSVIDKHFNYMIIGAVFAAIHECNLEECNFFIPVDTVSASATNNTAFLAKMVNQLSQLAADAQQMDEIAADIVSRRDLHLEE
jgi:hypothetical protein